MTSRSLLAGALLIALALGPGVGTAGAQQRETRRLKAIQAFEELLTETVHEHVQNAVSAFMRPEPGLDQDGRPDLIVSQPLVRVGSMSAAHGVYIDGYGVVFSIQRPPVAVIPRAFERRFREPWAVLRVPGDEGLDKARFLSLSVIDYRAKQIAESLGELELLLEQAQEHGDEGSVSEIYEGHLEEVRRVLDAVQVAEQERQQASESRDITIVLEQQDESGEESAETQRARDSYRRSARNRWTEYQAAIEQQRSVSETLRSSDQDIDHAVNDAAVETLSQFGSIINWLDDDEHVSVLVYAPRQFSFGVHTEERLGADEYIISVRYKDIREYGAGKFDTAGFRERIRIHDRLGAEMALRAREQQ